jgi:hypothetical protein
MGRTLGELDKLSRDLLIEGSLDYIKRLQKIVGDDGFVTYGFGTLLGIVREGGLIDGDDDIDVLIISKLDKKDILEQMNNTLERLGEDLLDCWHLDGQCRYKRDLKLTGQFHMRSEIDGSAIDGFWAWFEGDDLVFCQWGNCGRIDITPMNASFEGHEVKIPKDSAKMLKYLFGDWQVPSDKKIDRKRRGRYLYE